MKTTGKVFRFHCLFANVNVNKSRTFSLVEKQTSQKTGEKKSQKFLINFYRFRYYRANSVRYSTQPCEAACALNHYCAITRIDYNEFQQCLKSAASALASSSGKPSCFALSSTHLTLTLAIYSALNYQQKKIFIEWIHFVLIEAFIVRYFKEVLSAISNLYKGTCKHFAQFSTSTLWSMTSRTVAIKKFVGPKMSLNDNFYYFFTYWWIRKMNNFKICLIAFRIYLEKFLKTLFHIFIRFDVQQLKFKINQKLNYYLLNECKFIVSCQKYTTIDFFKLASFKENQMMICRIFKSRQLNGVVVTKCDDKFLKHQPSLDGNSVKQ